MLAMMLVILALLAPLALVLAPYLDGAGQAWPEANPDHTWLAPGTDWLVSDMADMLDHRTIGAPLYVPTYNAPPSWNLALNTYSPTDADIDAFFADAAQSPWAVAQ